MKKQSTTLDLAKCINEQLAQLRSILNEGNRLGEIPSRINEVSVDARCLVAELNARK